MPDGVVAKAVPTRGGGIAVVVRKQWTAIHGHRPHGDVLELSGEDHGSDPATEARLEVIRRADKKTFKYPMELAAGEGGGSSAEFTGRIHLKDVLDAESAGVAGVQEDEGDAAEPPDAEEVEDRHFWSIRAVSGGSRRMVGMPEDAATTVWRGEGRELALSRTRAAEAALIEQTPRPVVLEASWTPEGALRLSGELPEGAGPQEVLLAAREYGDVHAFPAEDASPGRFSATLAPARIESLAGTLPLREGKWDLYTRPAGAGDLAQRLPLMIDTRLYAQLPLSTTIARKPFALAMSRNDRALLVVERDLDDDERGLYHQRRLREEVYVASREQPLRDTVVYTSFDGAQYSDSPRAIHEELVRREAPFEHLWVVRDGQSEVPDSARSVREGSRAYYEALGSARFVVTNDLFPTWFARRPDQVCLQTWHGMPLKRLRADTPAKRVQRGRFAIDWQQQVRNWQHVLSPSSFATPILQSAYGIEGELLETGYPRGDLLAGADRDELGLEVRRRLGVPEGKRTVLYAPTFRDDVYDLDGAYRLDPRLDLESLQAAVGDDTVVLFRRHPYVVDAIPTDPAGALRDVSAYPDATELLLAADVLVTDYSSIMFDYAITGRPMLFHAYDLDPGANGVDGFPFDFAETVPGPLVRTADELAGALGDIERVQAEYASRYADFTAKFCELADGQASARVVDRLFSR
jgi:CDP-glycerol glycerophosphotransferase